MGDIIVNGSMKGWDEFAAGFNFPFEEPQQAFWLDQPGYGKTITARAWCEAVIQRVPDYIDSTDQAETAMVDLQSEANKSFGRRYKMKTFRWLSSEEVEGPSSST